MTCRLTLAWAAGATTGLVVGILTGVTVRDAVTLTRLRRPERRSGVWAGTTATPAMIGPQTGTQRAAHGPHCAEECARRDPMAYYVHHGQRWLTPPEETR